MRTETGLFVVFEGGDGAGKTTQVRRLAHWLGERGQDTLITHEPGDSLVGGRIRSLLLDPASGFVDGRAEALLYAADKAQHIHQVVLPALRRGAVVVCDRYVDSMLAYQGPGRQLNVDDLEAIARWATADLRPHLTVLLDVDPLDAVSHKADKDRLESEAVEFHQRVRQGFLALSERDPEHYLVLPARQSREAIGEAIEARVAAMLEELSAPSGTIVP